MSRPKAFARSAARHGVPLVIVAIIAVAARGESPAVEARPRARDIGIAPGDAPTGPNNALTDVPGVLVGHVSIVEGSDVRTGATAILPHGGDIYQDKVAAAIDVANGFGKLIGSTQVDELGVIETPIILTNTLNVWEAAATLAERCLSQPGNANVRSVNPVVGETNDGWLNEIRRRRLDASHFAAALDAAQSGPVDEGCVGAGAGTMAFGLKAGIGTSSRIVSVNDAPVMAGVLVQANFGGRLTIAGKPLWRELEARPRSVREPVQVDGSCMIVVATDAPLTPRQLKRLARRSFAGMARTGANFANGSGDYAIAFSTTWRRKPAVAATQSRTRDIDDAALTPLFVAVADAVEEAIYNSLLKAETTVGRDGHTAEALPVELARAAATAK